MTARKISRKGVSVARPSDRRRSRRWIRSAWTGLAVGLVAYPGLTHAAQRATPAAPEREIGARPPVRAALPSVPYWFSVDRVRGIDFIPLLWFNDIDGGWNVDAGDVQIACCVVGGAVRHRLGGTATVWWGIGIGVEGSGGNPSALEGAAQLDDGGSFSFRRLHGRNAFALRWPAISGAHGLEGALGVGAVWVSDARYIEVVPFFECPDEAPSFPCAEVATPYGWSDGRDHAIELELDWRGDAGPRVAASLAAGLALAGGDHDYARLEVTSTRSGVIGAGWWTVRLAVGWASGGSPHQRRFRLDGADPIRRWVSPYLEARGTLFGDLPYFVGGGPHLRAYQETKPIIKRFIGLTVDLRTGAGSHDGLWADGGLFLESTWLPGLPDRLGPETQEPGAAFLFDWRELPVGEGAELGQFRARSLPAPAIWADGGLVGTLGFKRIALTISVPLWASEPAFALDPVIRGGTSAFALRWTASVALVPGSR